MIVMAKLYRLSVLIENPLSKPDDSWSLKLELLLFICGFKLFAQRNPVNLVSNYILSLWQKPFPRQAWFLFVVKSHQRLLLTTKKWSVTPSRRLAMMIQTKVNEQVLCDESVVVSAYWKDFSFAGGLVCLCLIMLKEINFVDLEVMNSNVI